jgi:hypothetical protein
MSDCSGNDTDQRAVNGCYFITSKASEELWNIHGRQVLNKFVHLYLAIESLKDFLILVDFLKIYFVVGILCIL